MADSRTYIRVHDGMPDHPKVEPLSDAAFRLLVTTWCWCSRHLTDGRISAKLWAKRGTARTRRELIDAGLAEVLDSGDVLVHDYLEHQRSAEEVQEIREAKGRGGALGNHVRWHVRRRQPDPECEFCAASETDPGDVPDGSQDRSHIRSDNRSVSHRKTSPETSTETETDRSRADVDQSSSRRNVRATDDDDRDSKVDKQIITLLAELTGRTVTPEHAASVRRKLLDGRHVDNPIAYVTAAIRGAPRDHLPASHGNAPPVADARRAAGATGPGTDPNVTFRAERERMRTGRPS